MQKTMNNNTTTFWKFLNAYTIEIPIIQRDYAQGRLGKETLRKTFLADLKKALDSEETMKLDFVYGATDNGKLNPLDGQQRLTTLWLLHWYIALRAGELNEATCSIFKKFTYETRISSREFCECLCKPEYFKNFDSNDNVGFITNQAWFYSAWKQDPTIQSMLRMLGGTKIADKNGEDIVDGIEEIFQNTNKDIFTEYWKKLTEKETIIFYHLPLQDFGLSDDLYIKMNARGKQLTNFENFKADLIGYITKQSKEKEEDEVWKKLLDAKDGIPIKLDTVWTDIFWNNHSIDNKIDDIYFAFLNRFFWNELFTAKIENEYILKIGQGKSVDGKDYRNIENTNKSYVYLNGDVTNYSDLDPYKYYCNKTIPLTLFTNLTLVLDRLKSTIPVCDWDKSFKFIPEYNNRYEVPRLTQVHRIVFFALCKYYTENEYDEISMNRWMRVVWNLVSGDSPDGNPQIRSTEAIRNAIKFIDKLNSHSVYDSLTNYDTKELKDSDFDKRCKEEIEKSKQIHDAYGGLRKYEGSCKKEDGSDYQTWEEIIIDAEKFAFFKGAIRFLFTDGEGKINWCDFDTKWVNVQKYFDEKCGVKEEFRTNAVLLRALLSRIDTGENWFGYDINSWRTSLLSRDNQSAIHYLLTTNELVIEEACGRGWITNNDLLKTLLECYPTWHILNNWRGFSVLTRYTQRRSDATSQKEIVVLNDLRNKLLDDDKIEINPEIKVGESTYLYGWDINFKYNKHFFRWWGNPNETEPNVYLMEEGWADRKNRPNPTNDIGTDEDKYYCFLVDAGMTKENFTNKLECIINQAEQELLSLTD